MPDYSEKLRRIDFMDDILAKSRKTGRPVIPAKAGIQCLQIVAEKLDTGFYRCDEFWCALHG